MTTVLDRLREELADRYRLERELGEGGMATVYLAQDLRHGRRVALKVLRPELSAILGGERFLKEIQLTASLQHPHILALHDSGEAAGLVFYVMPYVEGESLRQRMNREKQLPVAEAVRIATEVAGALDYAHRHGVIHRDIKPENILLHDGSALVADFGIALAASSVGGGTRMTETGMSLGTPHYMSPEQALGEREITARSDVYALGCVTYEMLTAEPPFTGTTAQAIIARVMTDTPRSITMQRHTVPPHVEAAVLQALEKLPADRFATAAEFATALRDPGFGAGTTARTAATVAGASAAARPRRAMVLPVVLGAVALGALALAGWALTRPRPKAPVQRWTLSFAPGEAPFPDGGFRLSPDGDWMAYHGPAPGAFAQVWVKQRHAWRARPLAGTEDAGDFVFSPDGRWLAFVQNGSLKKIPVIGGAAITLADSISGAPGIAWMDNGEIAVARSGARTLVAIPSGGGPPRRIWSDSIRQAWFASPLPGSRGLVFTQCNAGCTGGQRVSVLDFESGTARELLPGVARADYLPTGHLLLVRPDGALLRMPFDPKRLDATGPAQPVGDSISVVDGVFPLISVANDGTLLMRTGVSGSLLARYRMVWIDRQGRQEPVDTSWTFRNVNYGANAGWALSPDGTRLAIGLSTDAGDDIWVKRLPAGPLVRVTFDSASEYRPRWMPDGRRVIFSTNRVVMGLYARPADGTGQDSLVLAGQIFEGQLTRDGAWLVARAGGQVNQVGGRNIGAMRVGVDTALAPLIATRYDESEIALSPDGRWIAYVSDETGRPEVFIRPFPDVDASKTQVSTRGGVAPLWRRDGRELFYISGAREMMVVPVQTERGLDIGESRRLFPLGEEIYMLPREYYTPFDVTADGQRFIMARAVESDDGGEAPLYMTLNWFRELDGR